MAYLSSCCFRKDLGQREQRNVCRVELCIPSSDEVGDPCWSPVDWLPGVGGVLGNRVLVLSCTTSLVAAVADEPRLLELGDEKSKSKETSSVACSEPGKCGNGSVDSKGNIIEATADGN